MIQGVLFDMDGVLLDSERVGRVFYLNACHKHGYPQADEAFYAKLLGTTTERSRQLSMEMMGEAFPYEAVIDEYRREMHLATVEGRMPLKPGMAECMAGLKARGIKIALATSTSRPSVEVYFEHIPEMRNVFDATVCGGEAGRSKPAPDIYLEAARRIGVLPENCIGVEDSHAGLQSLRAAGCVSVMVPDLLPFSADLAPLVDHRLDTLHQLCPLIDRLNLGGRVRG